MKKINDIIEKLKQAIKIEYSDFNGLYLYGSYANNNAAENSDIDIVALFTKSLSRDNKLKLWSIIGKLENKFDVFFDLHPMSKEELERNPIYYNQVVNKGIFYGI